MAAVYILFSKQLDKFYVGSCLEFLRRFDLHKSRHFHKSFTAKTDDWVLYYIIDNLEYSLARKVEAHIKKMRSRLYIENLTKFPEIVEKLKRKYA